MDVNRIMEQLAQEIGNSRLEIAVLREQVRNLEEKIKEKGNTDDKGDD